MTFLLDPHRFATGEPPIEPYVSIEPLGDWRRHFGVDGYYLFNFSGSGSHLDGMGPAVAVSGLSNNVLATGRFEDYCLEAVAEGLSTRVAAGVFTSSSGTVTIGPIAAGYVGTVHFYFSDHNSTARRAQVTIDGVTLQTPATPAVHKGAWIHFPVDVAPGGSIVATVAGVGGAQAYLSGVFLGSGPAVQTNDEITTAEAPQGDWVGAYGADGYYLAAWNAGADVNGLGAGKSLTISAGVSRVSFVGPTADVRALENAAETERRLGAFFIDARGVIRVTFTSAYEGNVHLYICDYNGTTRRQVTRLSDTARYQRFDLETSYNAGIWAHAPVEVDAGGHLDIHVLDTGASNGIVNGIFFGE